MSKNDISPYDPVKYVLAAAIAEVENGLGKSDSSFEDYDLLMDFLHTIKVGVLGGFYGIDSDTGVCRRCGSILYPEPASHVLPSAKDDTTRVYCSTKCRDANE